LYTGRRWVGCYISYSEEGTGRGRSPLRPLFAVGLPNAKAHPSIARVPITILLYNGPSIFGFNVAVEGYRRLRNMNIGLIKKRAHDRED